MKGYWKLERGCLCSTTSSHVILDVKENAKLKCKIKIRCKIKIKESTYGKSFCSCSCSIHFYQAQLFIFCV